MTPRRALYVAVVVVMAVACAATAGVEPASAAAAPYAASPPSPGALYRDGQTGRYLLGGAWLYRADPSDQGQSQRWQDEEANDGWSPVAVPSAFNAGDFSNASAAGAVGWYRRDFTLPSDAFDAALPQAERRWIVRFESVNYRATVWLNGRLLGTHAGAYLPFEFDLSAMHAGVNRLVVRVDSRRVATDLPPGPNGSWWDFGGILREVYLRRVEGLDISRMLVRTDLPCLSGARPPSGCGAVITERALVRNLTAKPQTVSLTGRFGPRSLNFGSAKIAPSGTWLASATTTLAHPSLWSIGHPNLYRATLALLGAKAQQLGGYVTYSGVRTVSVTPGGRLELNGRLLSLRGVNVHEQDRVLGAALDTAHQRRLIDGAEALGATIIRAHYPLGPQFEEMADRDGILIWSEIPVYHTQSSYLDQPTWLAAAKAVLRGDILANEDHPSVLLWSIGNELETPPPAAEATYIRTAAALAHRLDPTRPAGMAISSWPGVRCQAAYAPLDVIGFNDYFGWYDAGGGTTDDRDALSPFLDTLRACYPRKAIFVSEFGFEANRDGPVDERGTYAFQASAAAFHLGVFATKSWLSGALYFPLEDFAVNPGWGGGNPWPDPPFLHKGLLDLSGNPKPAFAIVSAIFHATKQIAR